MTKGTVFLSDLHLGDVLWDEGRYLKLTDFIDNFASKYANQVVVAGDLLEWIQYGFNSIAHCLDPLLELLQLAQHGIPIHFVVGNHDIDFCAIATPNLPIKLVYPKLHIDIDGFSFHVEHGHFHDPTIAAAPGAAKFFAAHGGRILDKLPQDVEHALGEFKNGLLSVLKRTTGQKGSPKTEVDGYIEAAARLAASDSGVHDYVVFGHTHKAGIVELGVPGKRLPNAYYVNCGDWQVHTDFAFFANGQMRVYSWESDKEEALAEAEAMAAMSFSASTRE